MLVNKHSLPWIYLNPVFSLKVILMTTEEYYSSKKKKKNGILSFETTGMHHEHIMLKEVRQRKASTVWPHLYVES